MKQLHVAAAESGDAAAAHEALRMAQKQIDMAVSKGLLKKNTAARRKSRLHQASRRPSRLTCTGDHSCPMTQDVADPCRPRRSCATNSSTSRPRAVASWKQRIAEARDAR